MTTINDEELEDLLARCFARLPKATEQVGCTEPVDVTSANCKQAMKGTLVALFTEAFHLVRFQAEKTKQMKAELSSTKSQLIQNQKKLRNSEKFSKVYVRPDRSDEERIQDRVLVQELLKKKEAEPNRLHYIRTSGAVHSIDKRDE
ncbi:hypothetical protein ACHWQZ_G000151 [Mnemiopsis leidyi]